MCHSAEVFHVCRDRKIWPIMRRHDRNLELIQMLKLADSDIIMVVIVSYIQKVKT